MVSIYLRPPVLLVTLPALPVLVPTPTIAFLVLELLPFLLLECVVAAQVLALAVVVKYARAA